MFLSIKCTVINSADISSYGVVKPTEGEGLDVRFQMRNGTKIDFHYDEEDHAYLKLESIDKRLKPKDV